MMKTLGLPAYMRVFLTVTSLTVTPVLVFISSAGDLFALHRESMGHDYHALLPFIMAALLATLPGIALSLCEAKPAKAALWFYYALGPIFFTYFNFAYRYAEAFPILPLAFIAACFVLSAIAHYRLSLGTATVFLGALGAFLLVYEPYSLAKKVTSDSWPIHLIENKDIERRPNAYLFIFDEFQTDIFDAVLTPTMKEHLGGFTYYPENTALFNKSGLSIRSIFSKGLGNEGQGSRYNSLLPMLKEAGYSEVAYTSFRAEDISFFKNFDASHEHTPSEQFIPASAFKDLWAYEYLPESVSKILLRDRFDAIKAKEFLPKDLNISSYKDFLDYLNDEEHLFDGNRFTYIYTSIPRPPYIFNEDCSFGRGLAETGPVEQSACAARMIVRFVEKLKKLHRYDDSLIIICSATGSYFKIAEGRPIDLSKTGAGQLELNTARSKALLLIKPPGKTSLSGFNVSASESSLIDIMPTVAGALGLYYPPDMNRRSLLNALPQKRVRYFFSTEKAGKIDWEKDLLKFIIKDKTMKNSTGPDALTEKPSVPGNI